MKNWTVKTAMETINEGTDVEGIKEIAKHFPLFFMAACRNDLTSASQLMTDKFTLNRLAKGPIEEVSEDEDEDVEVAAPAKKADVPVKKASAEVSEDNLADMTTKQLMLLCDKRGIKVPHYGKNKQYYLEMLEGGVEEAEEVEEAEDDAEEVDYTEMSAKELFNLCKERSLKVETKKPAKYYIDALKAADAAAATPEEVEEDWEEEEEEAPAKKPAKAPVKTPAKEEKKAAPKKPAKPAVEEEEEDGDDWDI